MIINCFTNFWNNFLPAIFFGLFSILAFLSIFGIGCLIAYSLHLMNKVLNIYLKENTINITENGDPKKTILNQFFIRYGILLAYFILMLHILNITKGIAFIFLLFFNHRLKKILKSIE
jgi:hypothetical protein